MNRRELLKRSALGIGLSLTGPTITTILNSCSPTRAPLKWEPRALTEEQVRTISSIAEVMLPETATPGALDLMIDRFVDVMIDLTYDAEEKSRFATELDAFIADCRSANGHDFPDCTETEQQEMIESLEKSSNKTTSQVWGKNIAEVIPTNFYRKLKGLILTGYYTSEEIGKHVLTYDPLPGKQIGCIPLSEVGNSWTEG